MNRYRFQVWGSGALVALLVFVVLAFGGADLWALVSFEVAVFALAAVFLVRLLQGALTPVWNPFYVPLAIACLWTGAQAWLGLSIYPYQTAVQALKWLAYLLYFLMAAHLFTDPTIRRGVRLALIWFAFALCAFALIQRFTAPGYIYWSVPIVEGRVFGPFVNSNHFAALLELLLPPALVRATRRSEEQLVYVGVSLMLLTSVVLSASRAGAILAAVEVVVVLLVRVWTIAGRRRRHRPMALALAGGAVAALALVTWMITTFPGLSERFREEQPYAVRWTIVRATWDLFLARPWTGFGAGTFDQVYPSAAPFDLGLLFTHAHNDPVEFAMEWGVLGLVVIGTILLLLFRRRWPEEVWLQVVLPSVVLVAHSLVDFPLQIPAITAAWLLTLAMLPPLAARQELSS